MSWSLRRRLARAAHSPAPHDEDGGGAAHHDVGQATRAGAKGENQDRCRTGDGWVVVSDGVGGHAGGACAAHLAVEAAAAVLGGDDGRPPGGVREAVVAAHAAVRAGQVADSSVHDMAATVTAAQALPGGVAGTDWAVGHVGDSPAWRVRPNDTVQVTVDHTLAGALLEAGQIAPAEAARHPGRRYVTRVAGAEGGTDPDVVEVHLAPGDALVLASDGVSDVLDPVEVSRTVRAPESAEAAAAALVAAAITAGTTDDATAVVIRCCPPRPRPGRQP